MKKIIRRVVGIILIIAGLLALLTPLTPGSWLALAGLELLGIRLLVERKLLSFLKPQHRAAIRRFFRRVIPRRRNVNRPKPPVDNPPQ